MTAVDGPVVEAFLTERKQRFALDAKALIDLADAKVPARVTDLMVALSYPAVFAVNPSTGESDFIPDEREGARGEGRAGYPRMSDPYYGWERYYGMGLYPFGYSPYGYSPYGYYGYGYPMNYGYAGFGYGGYGIGGGWYYGTTPVIIVRNDANTPSPAAPHPSAAASPG